MFEQSFTKEAEIGDLAKKISFSHQPQLDVDAFLNCDAPNRYARQESFISSPIFN